MTAKIKLVEKRPVATGTMAFLFDKPEGFTFRAGQYGDFTLINPPETDAEGNTRTFSLASSPNEGKLMIATRMRDSAFKRILGNLPAGSEIEMAGPLGALTIPADTAKPLVFLAGGIGITPFRSLSLYSLESEKTRPVTLFYANRRPEDAAFLSELSALAQNYPNFKFVPVMTDQELPQNFWEGERGHIDASMINKYVPDLTQPLFYLAGPPGMLSAMRQVLLGATVPASSIRAEEFSGY